MRSNVFAKPTGKRIILKLPPPHEAQKPFINWNIENPEAQVLVAPSGTKVGKSFGAALWLACEAFTGKDLYCVWIGPTYQKCQIGYRYLKKMLAVPGHVYCVDSKLEIHLANGTMIKFLHGQDAETTVEGEAVDRFVIDESGKQTAQLWFSLLTTITQTRGKGICTGTPRGFTWYYDIYTRAIEGDPFFCYVHLPTRCSPYVTKEAIEIAKKLLPSYLYDQYYEALFISSGSVFGDLDNMFTDTKLSEKAKFWIHPDKSLRDKSTVTGWDIAKMRDYSVFYTVCETGEMVGYARFNRVTYDLQVKRLKHYIETYFGEDRYLYYDRTGVGTAVEDILSLADIDASIEPVVFTNASKQEMVIRTTQAIEEQWHRAPRIPQLQHEFSSLEVKSTRSGLFSYAAPEGQHDDVVMAGIMAISAAFYKFKEDTFVEAMEAVFGDAEMPESIDDRPVYSDDGIDEYIDTEGVEDFFRNANDENLDFEGDMLL